MTIFFIHLWKNITSKSSTQHKVDELNCSIVIHSLYYIWVNYNNSLTWIKAIWGWFPLLTMIPVRSQWGRYNLPSYMSIFIDDILQNDPMHYVGNWRFLQRLVLGSIMCMQFKAI
jgi:hypothetical protein